MCQFLRVLIVEDSADDIKLLISTLRCGGYHPAYEVVKDSESLRAALQHPKWDVIIADSDIPRFNAQAALPLARELRPDLPFIVISGEIDLTLIVSLIKKGACDFIEKGEFAGLLPVIERELQHHTG
jgi:DNA-binding NtrC family response regulator